MRIRGRVLIVAGSDSGGGAGIQADIKTVTVLGGYAATAITALTAQSTEGVFGVHGVPPDFIRDQMRLVLGDIGADCIKIGMLHSAAVIEAVAAVLEKEGAGVPVVLDPVMVAKGGAPLLEADAVAAYRASLPRLATVMTPNLPEAEELLGRDIGGVEDMESAASELRRLGAAAVLLKGGHLVGDTVVDLLASETGTRRFENPRIETRHTHGTGCTLASAVAAGIARGLALDEAVAQAIDYVHGAIAEAPGFGRGHGPLNHLHPLPEPDKT
jgi:hydroxymethylpyrimidine/phosphomethylpyrimidine kinase